MKTITLSAEAHVIEAARERARREHTTLNEQFRRWLDAYARPRRPSEEALAVIEELRKHIDTGGRKWTREERNARQPPRDLD